MKKLVLSFCALALAASAGSLQAAAPSSPLDYQVEDINGKPVDLSQYKGKVVLIVNVASRCGNTKQYTNLESLYQKYGKDGFVILGFPANEFGKQEPGTNAEILAFCTTKFSVDFPMFSKIVVKGDGIAPLYQHLTSESTNPGYAGDISWNFEKFLIGRDGKVVKRIKPKMNPEEPEVVSAIEAELGKGK
jgi:glutathione peroxidase